MKKRFWVAIFITMILITCSVAGGGIYVYATLEKNISRSFQTAYEEAYTKHLEGGYACLSDIVTAFDTHRIDAFWFKRNYIQPYYEAKRQYGIYHRSYDDPPIAIAERYRLIFSAAEDYALTTYTNAQNDTKKLSDTGRLSKDDAKQLLLQNDIFREYFWHVQQLDELEVLKKEFGAASFFRRHWLAIRVSALNLLAGT